MGEPLYLDNCEPILKELCLQTRKKDWKKRMEAAKKLGDMGHRAKPAVQDLVILLHDKNENVMGTAIIAISKIRPSTRNVIQPLIRLLLHNSESISKMADYALNKLILCNRFIMPALIEALNETPLFDRCKIIAALGHIGPLAHDAYPDLFKIAQSNLTDDFAFNYVLDALDLIGFPKKESLAEILDLMRDRSGQIRFFSLPEYDENNPVILNHVLPLFEESIERYYNLHYKLITLIASVRINPSEMIPALAQSLLEHDKNIRRYAAECFSYIGPEAYPAIPDLINSLRDTHHAVRYYAAEALGYIGITAYRALPALNEARHDDNPTVRESATEAINKIHTRAIN